MTSFIFLFLASALACALLTLSMIFLSRYMVIGQSIREEGPASHRKKAGTPTMGGAAIFLAVIFTIFVFVDISAGILAAVFLFAGFALLGFTDDFIKIASKKNDGISPAVKILAQIFIALIFGIVLLFIGHEAQVSGILKVLHFNLGWLYLPFIVSIVVASSNAMNLTDGLDGLLAGTALIAFITFAVISSRAGANDIAGLCAIVAGALLGFLVFNRKPAKIFMGDIGSLSLGALLAAVAILIHKELILLLVGGVFAAETLSVIIQVSYFKTTGKRIFKMSPLHHHFELSGMKEEKIVLIFWAISIVLGFFAVIVR